MRASEAHGRPPNAVGNPPLLPRGTKSTMESKDHDKPAVSTRLRLGPEEWGTPTERGTDSSIAEIKLPAPPDRAKTVHYNPNNATESTNDEGGHEHRPTRLTNEPAKPTRRQEIACQNNPAPKSPAERPPPCPANNLKVQNSNIEGDAG